MPKMIQIRNVSDKLHHKLKSLAASEGLSLSEYLLKHLRNLAERPTATDMRARLRRRTSVTLPVAPAEVLRQERDQH